MYFYAPFLTIFVIIYLTYSGRMGNPITSSLITIRFYFFSLIYFSLYASIYVLIKVFQRFFFCSVRIYIHLIKSVKKIKYFPR